MDSTCLLMNKRNVLFASIRNSLCDIFHPRYIQGKTTIHYLDYNTLNHVAILYLLLIWWLCQISIKGARCFLILSFPSQVLERNKKNLQTLTFCRVRHLLVRQSVFPRLQLKCTSERMYTEVLGGQCNNCVWSMWATCFLPHLWCSSCILIVRTTCEQLPQMPEMVEKFMFHDLTWVFRLLKQLLLSKS